jgi:hypothetical protein
MARRPLWVHKKAAYRIVDSFRGAREIADATSPQAVCCSGGSGAVMYLFKDRLLLHGGKIGECVIICAQSRAPEQ